MRPAESPGRLLERCGDAAPRGMTVAACERRTEPGLQAGSATYFRYLNIPLVPESPETAGFSGLFC